MVGIDYFFIINKLKIETYHIGSQVGLYTYKYFIRTKLYNDISVL